MIKLFWRTIFSLFSGALSQNTELTIVNCGYATTQEEDLEGLGLMRHGELNQFRNQLDRYRFQMYQHVVIENGGLDDMHNKTVLETGCGRGGGLNFIAQLMRPRYAIGVDSSRSNIEYCK